MSFHEHFFDDRAQLRLALSNRIAEALTKNAESDSQEASRQKNTLLVSGGSTPLPLFQSLSANCSIDWEQTLVSLVDERYVVPDHDASNAKLVREHLLQDQAAPASFIPHYDTGDLDTDLASLETWVEGLPAIDCLILGMGSDGHTASLFPGVEACEDALNQMVSPSATHVISCQPQSAAHTRISLTPRAIAKAKSLFLHIEGVEKRQVYESAKVARSSLPIGRFLANDTFPIETYWAP